MKGPEDLPAWSKAVGDAQAVDICVRCENKVHVWHCANSGCPWCKACGDKIYEKEKK